MYSSILDLWDKSSNLFSNNSIFIDREKFINISYRTAFSEIAYLSNYFQNFGIRKGDKVCLYIPDFLQNLILQQSIISMGAVSVISEKNDYSEFYNLYKKLSAKVLITNNSNLIDFFISQDENFLFKSKKVIYIGSDEKYKSNSRVVYFEKIILNFNTNLKLHFKYKNKLDDISNIFQAKNGEIVSYTNRDVLNAVMDLGEKFKSNSLKDFLQNFYVKNFDEYILSLFLITSGCKIIHTDNDNFYNDIKNFKPDLLFFNKNDFKYYYNLLQDKITKKDKFYRLFFNLNYKISKKLLKYSNNKIFKKVLSLQQSFIYTKLKRKVFDFYPIVYTKNISLDKYVSDFFLVTDCFKRLIK